MRRIALAILGTALWLWAGCAEDATGPADFALQPVAGGAQSGLAGVPLLDSLAVRVTDADGQPVTGQEVVWTPLGDDSLFPGVSSTDANGLARTLRLLGPGVGTDTVTAHAGGQTVSFAATGELATPGVVYTGRQDYVTYVAGSLPIILSAPHGGTLEPTEIPDRVGGTQVRDMETDRLAAAVADSIEARLGARPHLIISHLHRRKLDPNRSLAEAAEHPLAEHAWREFQGFIEHASSRVEEGSGAGLFLDVHGHGHDIQRLELGYLLDSEDLARSDSVLDDTSLVASSSLRALAERADASFPELIRGPLSLGTLFESGGVPAVPSQAQPDPGVAPYFSGGYNTRRHGSRDAGTVDGIQIESHWSGVRDSPEHRAMFGGVAADVLQRFLTEHYGITFGG